MCSALDVAKYTVSYCNTNGIFIDNTKLQYVLYYIQKKYYSVYKKPCFSEKITVGEYGPVVNEVFDYYKNFGNMSITGQKKVKKIKKLSKSELGVINDIIENTVSQSAYFLMKQCQSENEWITAEGKENKEIVFLG